jgi:hypothetical protein
MKNRKHVAYGDGAVNANVVRATVFMSWLTVFIVIEDGALNAQFMTSANGFR